MQVQNQEMEMWNVRRTFDLEYSKSNGRTYVVLGSPHK